MASGKDVLSLEEVVEIAERGDIDILMEYFHEINPAEASRTLSRLGASARTQILYCLGHEEAAKLVGETSDTQAAEIINQLSPEHAAEILSNLPGNRQADLLGSLGPEGIEPILRKMEPEVARRARQLVQYPPDTAGGLMTTEFLSYGENLRVKDVIADFQEHAEEYSDYEVQYAYVTSKGLGLTGVLRLRDLLLARSTTRISEIMVQNPQHVQAYTPLDVLSEFFDRYKFIGVPVTDEKGALLGVVHRHQVEEALADRSGNDYLKSQGIVGGEEFRTMPLFRRSSRRLSWLSINIVLNIIAASIIAVYQDTLSQVIALAVFLPIISDMSGCSGNQAVAVSMRELSLGLVRPVEVLRVWLKEISIGAINGAVLGALLAASAWLWKGNPYLGLVVGSAMAANTMVAVSVGGTVPLLLKKFKFDPALASGPILTTVTDMAGFFFVLSFATVMLSKLSGL